MIFPLKWLKVTKATCTLIVLDSIFHTLVKSENYSDQNVKQIKIFYKTMIQFNFLKIVLPLFVCSHFCMVI